MAGTFSVRLVGTLTNALHSESFGATSSKSIVQVGDHSHTPVVTVNTGANYTTGQCTQITSGDINELGYIYLKNLDTGNMIFIGPEYGAASVVTPIIQLEPSGETWFRTSPGIQRSGGGLYAQAVVAPCKLQVKWFEA